MKLYAPLSFIVLSLSSIVVLPHFAQASVCRTEFQSEKVAVNTCLEASGLIDWTLIIQKANSSEPLVLRAHFFGDSNSFRQFWSENRNLPFEGDDQDLLRKVLSENSAQKLELSRPSSTALRFLVHFVETPIAFDSHDANQAVRRPTSFRQYSPICNFIGKKRTARYTAHNRQHTLTTRVGVTASGCWGRCGPGCTDDGFSPNHVYTQECLNHDACEHMTGQRMGECQDEFWEAADGFMNAPSC